MNEMTEIKSTDVGSTNAVSTVNTVKKPKKTTSKVKSYSINNLIDSAESNELIESTKKPKKITKKITVDNKLNNDSNIIQNDNISKNNESNDIIKNEENIKEDTILVNKIKKPQHNQNKFKQNFNNKNKKPFTNNNNYKNGNFLSNREKRHAKKDARDLTEVIEKTPEQLAIDSILYIIKQKSGITPMQLISSIDEYKNQYGVKEFEISPSLNLVAFCILNDNPMALKLLRNTGFINNHFPKILYNHNISCIFDKSFELNNEVINYLLDDENKALLIDQLIEYAPKNLYREENIKLICSFINEHFNEENKKVFLIKSLESGNKPLLKELFNTNEYRELLSSLDEEVNQSILTDWIKYYLKNNKVTNSDNMHIQNESIDNGETLLENNYDSNHINPKFLEGRKPKTKIGKLTLKRAA